MNFQIPTKNYVIQMPIFFLTVEYTCKVGNWNSHRRKIYTKEDRQKLQRKIINGGCKKIEKLREKLLKM